MDIIFEEKTRSGRTMQVSTYGLEQERRWFHGWVELKIGTFQTAEHYYHREQMPDTEEKVRKVVRDILIPRYITNIDSYGSGRRRINLYEKVARAFDVGAVVEIDDSATEAPVNGGRFFIGIANGDRVYEGRIVRTPRQKVLFARTLKSARAVKKRLIRSLDRFLEKVKALDPALVPSELPDYKIFQIKEGLAI